MSGDAYKASRNLIHCARSTTKLRNDREAVEEALECWHCLAQVEPGSPEARQGVAWCQAALARFAEDIGEWPAARTHWSAVLAVAPDDRAAMDGLRRAVEAEAAVAPQNAARARAMYDQLSRVTGPEYGAQFTAARLLFEAGAPDLALEFVERALAHSRAAEALVLLVRCLLGMSQYQSAAAALNQIAPEGGLAAIPATELETLLSNAPPGALARTAVAQIANLAGGDAPRQSALVPHLLAHDLHAEIAAAADLALDDNDAWPEVLVLETARDLLKNDERDRALRLLARFCDAPNVAHTFCALAEAYAPDNLDEVMSRAEGISEDSRFLLKLAAAEYHASKGDWNRASAILALDVAGRAYRQHAERLGLLVAQIAGGGDPAIAARIARFVAALVPENTKAFFVSPEFETLCEELAAAARFHGAPKASRTGRFREHYFAHHMERRENLRVETLTRDFALCDVVLHYLSAMERFRPAERTPIPAELVDRLAQPALRLGEGHADVLMSYAILRDRPDCDLKSGNLFAELAEWYVGRFMADNHVPSCCIGPAVLTHFNAVEHDHSKLRIGVTHFAKFLQSESRDLSQYRLDNPLEALLFCLDAIPTLVAHPRYRPFFAAMLAAGSGTTFADRCLAALSGRDEVPFTRILNGDPMALASGQGATIPRDAARDVLLIGHSGEGTGLSRNFRMLSDGLGAAADIRLTTLFYETEPEQFAEALKHWREKSGSRPIVIAAVNAHDVPALFIRDRHGVLENCLIAGFFLWETSQAPRVQHLGIALVDEVWTPTRYVADVYAPFAVTRVIGKGLFAPDAAASIRERAPGPLRFLTVFDFHSSIERKNPLASVLAFRKAFPNGEDVELIVKASNVNPQHPGNAFGQWERLCAEAAHDSRIRIITARFSEAQMKALIDEVGCVVSLHRSEGFGYVLSDAMAAGIPVIATAHSGNLDFCTGETSFGVGCELVAVNALGAHWEGEGAVWADPDLDSAAAQMRRVYQDYPAALRVAAVGQRTILSNYSIAVFAGNLHARIAGLAAAACGVDPPTAAVQ